MAYKKILLAVDFADHTEMLCAKAKAMAEVYDASVAVIHVVEPIVSDSAFDTLPPIPVDFDDMIINQSKNRLEQLAERYSFDKSGIYLEIGVTKKEIIRVAEEQSVDLIIVGSHGRHGVELLLGSTANAVLHHATCDVLAVRIAND